MSRATQSLALLLTAGLAGCVATVDAEALRAELKRELLAELRAAPAMQGVVAARPPAESAAPAAALRGVEVAGTVTWRGRGIPDVRVQLQRLPRSGGADASDAIVAEARTDPHGRFVIPGVPRGDYRLRWQYPRDTGWIRRARSGADVRLDDQSTVELPPIVVRPPVGVWRGH